MNNRDFCDYCGRIDVSLYRVDGDLVCDDCRRDNKKGGKN